MLNSEPDLVQSCPSGNLEDFSQLYDKYIRKIYDFIYYRTHHQQTAEDLTSITFTKALENIKRFNSQKGSLATWLYRIARNTVIDHYRTQKTEANIDDIWDLGSNENLPRDIDTKEKLIKVQEYLEKLQPEQRDLIIMRVWDGLSYKEISEITKKSETALKMMFSRVIKKLKNENSLALMILLLLIELNN